MNTRIRSVLALVAALATLVVGCSSDGDTAAAGSGEGSSSAHSNGVPIVRGEWPFSTDERCSDGRAPACLRTTDQGAQISGLTAAGSRFVSSDNLTVTYRGGMVVRTPGPDSDNPESRRIITFYDMTFPKNAPDGEELRKFLFKTSIPEHLSWTPHFMGGSHQEEAWPNSTGMRGDLFYQPEPGEILTFAHISWVSGPTSLLGEHDPFIMLHSDYSVGRNRDSTSGAFAILDQDPDSDVLDDVLASIEKVAAEDPAATGGRESFEQMLRPWLEGGRELVSVDELNSTGEEHMADVGGGTEVGPADGPEPADAPPPPPPPPPAPAPAPAPTSEPTLGDELYELGFSDGMSDFNAGNPWDHLSNDPDPSSSDYYYGYEIGWEEAAYQQANIGSLDTGRVYAQPVQAAEPEDAVFAMVADLGVPPDIQDCDTAPPSAPCISVPRHTHWAGVDHTAYAEVRLTPKDTRSEFDFALLITAHEPTVDGWVVDREWTVGDGEKPSWVR